MPLYTPYLYNESEFCIPFVVDFTTPSSSSSSLVSKWIFACSRVLDELAVDAAFCLPDAETKNTFGILTLFLYMV